jgi:F0F1-type ATP synthase membrane subunit a
LEVVYALVVVLGFQIYKVERQGFLRYTVADVEYISNFMPKCFKFGLDFI